MTVASESSFDFIALNLKKNAKVLEVGCGKGELALLLQQSGIDITAIDIEPAAIEIAIKNNVNAKVCDIFDVNDTFDVLLFTRSLHHIHHLEKVILHAKNILSPHGKIILEEFDYLNVNASTTKWYYNHLDGLNKVNLVHQSNQPGQDYLQRWKDEHDHTPPLNSGNEMIKQIEKKFKSPTIQKVPYLFRSIEQEIFFKPDSINEIRQLLKEEIELIKTKSILPVGLRLIAES